MDNLKTLYLALEVAKINSPKGRLCVCHCSCKFTLTPSGLSLQTHTDPCSESGTYRGDRRVRPLGVTKQYFYLKASVWNHSTYLE